MQFEQTGVQQVTIQGIYDENRSIGIGLPAVARRRTRQNYADQVDSLVDVRKASATSAGETRAAIERVLKPYPRVEGRGPDRVQGLADRAVQHDPEPALRDAVPRGRSSRSSASSTRSALSIYERTRELGLLRAVGHDPPAAALDGARRGRDHRDLRLAARARDRVVFAWAMVERGRRRGHRQFSLPVTQLVIFVILAGLVRLPRRRVAGAAGGQARRAGGDPVAVGPVQRRILYRVFEVPWEPAWRAGA